MIYIFHCKILCLLVSYSDKYNWQLLSYSNILFYTRIGERKMERFFKDQCNYVRNTYTLMYVYNVVVIIHWAQTNGDEAINKVVWTNIDL